MDAEFANPQFDVPCFTFSTLNLSQGLIIRARVDPFNSL